MFGFWARLKKIEDKNYVVDKFWGTPLTDNPHIVINRFNAVEFCGNLTEGLISQWQYYEQDDKGF